MKTRISKVFDFDAGHRLEGLPDGHKCRHLHGHTYRVEIEVCGEPDDNGMVVDYANLAAAWAPLHDQLDHSYLASDGDPIADAAEAAGLKVCRIGGPTTTENLAAWIWERLFVIGFMQPILTRVRVYESSTTQAEVEL